MQMNLANKITMVRVVLIPLFLILFLTNILPMEERRIWAAVIFIIASLTDALDGYIARSQNLVTNFGKFADPLADKLLVTAALISMVSYGDLSAWAVVIIISREFIVTGFRQVAASNQVVIAASFWGKIKTVTQMVMIIYVMLDIKRLGIVFLSLNSLLIWLAVLFTVVSGIDYIIKNRYVLKD